jgi:hypothetical protein
MKSTAKYAMRVRRSSDDAHANIGFIGENLDEAALLAHCGSGSGYIQTWYAQDGNTGNDFVQNTAAYQPRIVNAGVIDRDFDAAKCAALWPTFASAAGVTLATNGNFVNTTGWTQGSGSLSASSNTAISTGAGATANMPLYQDTNTTFVPNKRMYVKALVRVTNTSCQSLTLECNPSTSGSTGLARTIATPTQNEWYAMSGVATLASNGVGNVRIVVRSTYADSATQNGKVMEVQEVVCIDVTNYGRPAAYLDGSNDVMTKPLYPDATQAAALWPTFASTASLNVLTGTLASGFVDVNTDTKADGYTYGSSLGGLSVSSGIVGVTFSGTANASANNWLSIANKLTLNSRYAMFITAKRNNSVGANTINFANGYNDGTAITLTTDYTRYGIIHIASTANTGNTTFAIVGVNTLQVSIQSIEIVDVTALDTTNILGAPMLLNSVFNNAAQNGFIIAKNLSTTDYQYSHAYITTNKQIQLALNGSQQQVTATDSAPNNRQCIGTHTSISGIQYGYINGVASGGNGSYNTELVNRPNMNIGAQSTNAGGTTWSVFFKGYISEIIIATDVSKRQKIEQNQMKYYAPK